jgi:hypothetical protein
MCVFSASLSQVKYSRELGLEVRADAPIEDLRWLTVGPKGQPEVEIGLLPPQMGRTKQDADA